ncbi:metallophosphoesterase [Emticicia sp. CRIBPO]|uniref:metallophosphoesterase n=1 Tax=Emticicia sp. CRIBPO TaxID=2683258 RepID=UPI001412D8CB|nr:metallophosphoesterase [Emticicia sp. CRIBPO]NBA85394.1 metallophosphoesterase [Emticicia sp. CRIBPO]
MNRLFTLGILILFFLLVDYYLFQAVKTIIRNYNPNTQRIIKIVYWSIPVVAMVIIVSGLVLFPAYLNFKFRNLLFATVFILYLSKLLAAVVLVLGDIVRFFRWALSYAGSSPSADTNSHTIPRSEFIAKTALAVGGAHFGAMAYGIISGAHDYRIRNVVLKLPNLPRQFEGLKIAQLSDIHSGSFFNKTAVQGGVEMLMSQKPDVFFFTGDLVNNEAKEFEDYFNVFNKIKAPLGMFSTLGNHDYGDYTSWASPQAKIKNLQTLQEAHRLMGWDLLMDESRDLKVDGESIGILGIQNWGAGNFAKYGSLEKALKNTDQYATKLLLSHDPSHWRNQVLNKTNIDAAFAGHTHGMQYGVEIGGIKWSPVQYRYKEWAGLYEENNQKLYVNRGFGYIGYPGRIGILPEISVFELKRA